MADRCDLTDLPVTDCAHCRGIPYEGRTEAARPSTGPGAWFEARYAGRCSHCNTDFDAGDEIRGDGEGGWLAACCGEDDH